MPSARKRLALRVVAGLAAGWAILAATLFVWPPEHVPDRADAVIVLAGARGPRLARGLELVRRGVAPVLVVSDGWGLAWPEANRLCAGRPLLGAPVRIICFRPNPYSTRGEARGFARLAARHGWRSVLVVTSGYHRVRARMLFDRCFRGVVSADGARQTVFERAVAAPLETLKLAYAYTRRGC